MLTLVPVLLAVGAGLVAGVFFAFSTFVMKALAQLPSEQGVAAMQRINVVVMNPVFLALFVGTALIAAICGVGAVLSWGSFRSALLLAAGVLYIAGCFGVTVVFNVPRNERLARLQPVCRSLRLLAGLLARAGVLEPHPNDSLLSVRSSCNIQLGTLSTTRDDA